jgi:hypothetical protein
VKLARIYIRPLGDRWFDMQLQDGQTAQTVFSAMRSEGAIVHPLFVVPMDCVHYIAVFEVNEIGGMVQPPGRLN